MLAIAGHFPDLPPTPKPRGAGHPIPARSARSPEHGRNLGGRGGGYASTRTPCVVLHCTANTITSDSRFCVAHEPDEDGVA